MCVDPDLMGQILNDRDFIVHHYGVEHIEKRFNIDLSHISNMVDHFPLAREGEKHKANRKQLAVALAQNSELALANFKKTFEEKIQRLPNNTRFDLVTEVIKPSLSQILLDISGITISNKPAGFDSLSQVLDETLSLKKRIEINRTIGDLLLLLPEDLPQQEKYFRVAMLALGSDGLIGTVTESLAQILTENEGMPCRHMDWNVEVPCTGVPVLERIAQTEKTLAGEKILAGQRIRLYVDAAGYSESDSPVYSQLYFGAGKHTCLGMPISKKIWGIIRTCFQQLDSKLSIHEIKYRANDNVFNLYEHIVVTIHD